MVFYVPRSLAKRPYRLARSRTHGFHPCNRGSNPRGDAILKPAFRGGFFGAWARWDQVRAPLGVRRKERSDWRRDELRSSSVAERSRASGTNPRGDAILKPAFRGGFFGAWARKCWFGALAGGKTTQKAATIPSKRATAGDDAFPAGKFVLVEVEVKLDVAQHLHLLNDRHAGTVFAAKNFVDFGAVTDDFRS